MAAGTETATTIIRPLVLIVDDEPAVLEALEALLAPRLEPWFKLVSARSVRESLDLLQVEDDTSSPLALAISDEKMPGGTGTDLLVQLRDRPGHVHGGRIIVTGYASLDSAKRAINDAEVARYYPKPWDSEGALLPAVGEILGGFLAKRGLDRLLIAMPVDWPTARAESLAIRQAWWEYIQLMGLPAAELELPIPEFEKASDSGATHVMLQEWSPVGTLTLAAARLACFEPEATLDDVAFVPGAATDLTESLLVRTARCQAQRLRCARLKLRGSPVRDEFYRALGFTTPSEVPDPQPVADPMVEWTCELSEVGEDAWARRYAREHRLCSCSQVGCPGRDYDVAKRNYYCPLDQLEARSPEGYPAGAGGRR